MSDCVERNASQEREKVVCDVYFAASRKVLDEIRDGAPDKHVTGREIKA